MMNHWSLVTQTNSGWDSNEFMYSMVVDDVDGGIVSFENYSPKWSFVLDDDGFVSEVAEKKPISNIALSVFTIGQKA